MVTDPKKLMDKLSTVMQKVEEVASSEIKSEKDYLQVCGALMAVTRNMYEKALGPAQTQQMLIKKIQRKQWHFLKRTWRTQGML